MFGTCEDYAQNQAAGTIENRYNLVQFCIGNELQIMNTHFDCGKDGKAHCTFKDMTTSDWTGPWNTDRCNMIDYCLSPSRWKNTVTNVKAEPQIALNTDHALLEIEIRTKLNQKEKNIETLLKEKFDIIVCSFCPIVFIYNNG
jgi:endonuclease/exonuclease/phosphatase family metal-dependent hydrolase